MKLPLFHVISVKLDETALAVVALGVGIIVAELHKIDPSSERLAIAFGSALAGFISKGAIDAMRSANAPKETPPSTVPDKQNPAA